MRCINILFGQMKFLPLFKIIIKVLYTLGYLIIYNRHFAESCYN